MTSLNNSVSSDVQENGFRYNRGSRAPLTIIAGVDVSFVDGKLTVKGEKGESVLCVDAAVRVTLNQDEKTILIEPNAYTARAIAGTTVALISNMMKGVTTGHEKILEINGVGYRAKLEGANLLDLSLGFSHPVKAKIPAGLKVVVEGQTKITITGVEKQAVGQFAANIRSVRPPEPYKGKGIKYADEHIIRKETKKK